MIDDRDFSWLGPKQAAPAVAVEHVLWTVTKDIRTASLLVRQHRHGQDLICFYRGDLLWSQVFRPGDGRDLGKVAEDTLSQFEARSWLRVAEARYGVAAASLTSRARRTDERSHSSAFQQPLPGRVRQLTHARRTGHFVHS